MTWAVIVDECVDGGILSMDSKVEGRSGDTSADSKSIITHYCQSSIICYMAVWVIVSNINDNTLSSAINDMLDGNVGYSKP